MYAEVPICYDPHACEEFLLEDTAVWQSPLMSQRPGLQHAFIVATGCGKYAG